MTAPGRPLSKASKERISRAVRAAWASRVERQASGDVYTDIRDHAFVPTERMRRACVEALLADVGLTRADVLRLTR